MATETASQVSCAACGKQFIWRPPLAGKKGKCPCGAIVEFPAIDPAAVQTPEPVEEHEADDDPYDIVEPEPPLRPSASPAGAPAGNVLAYRSAEMPRTVKGTAGGKVQQKVDLSDPWEGSLPRNLYLPAGIILVSTVFQMSVGMFLGHSAAAGMAWSAQSVGLRLVVNIPLMLLACVVAVKLLDVSFGPLGPAILKLCAIALAPDAVFGVMTLIGAGLGAASSGSAGGAIIGGAMGMLLGWAASLIVYFGLFVFFFDLAINETMYLVIIIWIFRTIGGSFILNALHGM